MTKQPSPRYCEATLLIVDDDDIDAIALERALRRVKLLNLVRRARDGQEALDMIRSGNLPGPYLVLLDLNMPRMNGLEFLEIVRRDPVLTSMVVFVLTTSSAEQDVVAAYREHVAGYFLKQRAAGDFMEIIGLIEHYWRMVELPVRQGGVA